MAENWGIPYFDGTNMDVIDWIYHYSGVLNAKGIYECVPRLLQAGSLLVGEAHQYWILLDAINKTKQGVYNYNDFCYDLCFRFHPETVEEARELEELLLKEDQKLGIPYFDGTNMHVQDWLHCYCGVLNAKGVYGCARSLLIAGSRLVGEAQKYWTELDAIKRNNEGVYNSSEFCYDLCERFDPELLEERRIKEAEAILQIPYFDGTSEGVYDSNEFCNDLLERFNPEIMEKAPGMEELQLKEAQQKEWQEPCDRHEEETENKDQVLVEIRKLSVKGPQNDGYEHFTDGLCCLFEEADRALQGFDEMSHRTHTCGIALNEKAPGMEELQLKEAQQKEWQEPCDRHEEETENKDQVLVEIRKLSVKGPQNDGYEHFTDGLCCLFEEADRALQGFDEMSHRTHTCGIALNEKAPGMEELQLKEAQQKEWQEPCDRHEEETENKDQVIVEIRKLFVKGPQNDGYEHFTNGLCCLFEEADRALQGFDELSHRTHTCGIALNEKAPGMEELQLKEAQQKEWQEPCDIHEEETENKDLVIVEIRKLFVKGHQNDGYEHFTNGLCCLFEEADRALQGFDELSHRTHTCGIALNEVGETKNAQKMLGERLKSVREDLPGFTRSVYKKDHALITPESHVFSPLPEWSNTMGAYLVTPAMGSHFVMYLAKMEDHSKSGLPPDGVERLIFVVEGSVILRDSYGISYELTVDSYAYLPPEFEHSIKCDTVATLVVFERRYASLENHIPEFVVGSTDKQPLLETPGEIFELRKLLPTSLPYDFNIHIMDFQPGEFLNVKEVHYNQHGLLLLEGQGIYRLGNSWYPVQAGDVIWMAPFVPQWYAALGKTRSRYLLYKDVNRNPL